MNRLGTKDLDLAFSSKIRFMKYVSVVDSGCWEWTGALTYGYGSFYLNGTQKAHRISYLMFKGYLSDLPIDHLCRNRKCVNPEHLELVTSRENTYRGLHGRLRKQCKNGHLYSKENTKFKQQTRVCKICVRISQKKTYDLNREELLAKARVRHRAYYRKKMAEDSRFNIIKRNKRKIKNINGNHTPHKEENK